MTARRTQNPSPLAGEVAARSAAGEGLGDRGLLDGDGSLRPSPGRSLRSRPSSPVKGEGKDAAGEGLGGRGLLDGDGSHRPSPGRWDRWFAANRFRVMRFWNNEVLSNLEGVMTVLAEALAAEKAQ